MSGLNQQFTKLSIRKDPRVRISLSPQAFSQKKLRERSDVPGAHHVEIRSRIEICYEQSEVRNPIRVLKL